MVLAGAGHGCVVGRCRWAVVDPVGGVWCGGRSGRCGGGSRGLSMGRCGRWRWRVGASTSPPSSCCVVPALGRTPGLCELLSAPAQRECGGVLDPVLGPRVMKRLLCFGHRSGGGVDVGAGLGDFGDSFDPVLQQQTRGFRGCAARLACGHGDEGKPVDQDGHALVSLLAARSLIDGTVIPRLRETM